jgi:hypothetical protein
MFPKVEVGCVNKTMAYKCTDSFNYKQRNKRWIYYENKKLLSNRINNS